MLGGVARGELQLGAGGCSVALLGSEIPGSPTPLVPGLGSSRMDAPAVGQMDPTAVCISHAVPPLSAIQGRPQLWKSESKAGNCPSPTREFLLGTWAKKTGDFPFPLLPSLSPEVTRLLQGNPPSLSPC